MRFAWYQRAEGGVSTEQDSALMVAGIRMAYNIAWWIPILLTFIGTIDYDIGFVLFAVVTAVRLVANLFVNNVLTPEQAKDFPFRM